MRTKLLCILTLLLGVASGAWAVTESSGNTGTNNTAWTGTSCTLDGKYIAGKGGQKLGNMPDKGVKLRSNQGNLVFEVNAGIKITSFKFWGCGNTTTAVDVESATVDGGSNLLASTVTLPGTDKSASGDIALTGLEATKNITLTFASGSSAQIVGTWQIEYEVTAVITQEITAVTLNGTAISDADLTTLKSTKALTLDGSALNGSGVLAVTLSSGSTNVSKAFNGTSAVYTFTINSTDEYTVTVTNVNKTYTAEGLVVSYASDYISNSDKTLTANGIVFNYSSKTFGWGSGRVTLGGTEYQPIKLSTGEGVSVTFPEGKVATKIIVYGWSTNGNGYMKVFKDGASGANSISTSANIFYANNADGEIYPSVYEYPVDNWEALYFECAGGQPFIVVDFVLIDAASVVATQGGDVTFTTKKSITASVEGSGISIESTASSKSDGDGHTLKNGNSITITAEEGKKITAITVTYGRYNGNTALSVDDAAAEDYTVSSSTGTWSGLASKVVLSGETDSNPDRVTQITVEYASKFTTLNASGYGTLSYGGDVQVFGVKAYQAALDFANEKITCTALADNKVKAGEGVLLFSETASAPVYLRSLSAAPMGLTGNDLKGTTDAEGNLVAKGSNDCYVLSGDTFKKFTGSAFKANKAYFEVVSGSAPNFSIVFDDGMTTDIQSVEQLDNLQSADSVFDLQGRKVSDFGVQHLALKPGLYIVNGKKVVIK